MIEFVTLTGKSLNGLVECSAGTRNFYARPVFTPAFISIPVSKWLAVNKNKFFGVITYEKEKERGEFFQYERPLLIGVVPANNTFTDEDIIDRHYIESSVFYALLDDVNNLVSIGVIGDDSFSVIMDYSTKTITQKGSKIVSDSSDVELTGDASDSAVLGSELISVLNNLITTLASLTVVGTSGPEPLSPDVITALNSISGSLNDILSKKVKLS